MYKLVLASRNKNKSAELREMFSDVGGEIEILSLDDIGYEGDIEEDGDSYEMNSVIKSSVPVKFGYIGIADDSGLSVDALDGAPGIYSARYAGAHVTYSDNNEKLLKVLENEDNRAAKFVCAMSITVPEGLNVRIPDDLTDRELSAYATAKAGRACRVRGEPAAAADPQLDHSGDNCGGDPAGDSFPAGVRPGQGDYHEPAAMLFQPERDAVPGWPDLL